MMMTCDRPIRTIRKLSIECSVGIVFQAYVDSWTRSISDDRKRRLETSLLLLDLTTAWSCIDIVGSQCMDFGFSRYNLVIIWRKGADSAAKGEEAGLLKNIDVVYEISCRTVRK